MRERERERERQRERRIKKNNPKFKSDFNQILHIAS